MREERGVWRQIGQWILHASTETRKMKCDSHIKLVLAHLFQVNLNKTFTELLHLNRLAGVQFRLALGLGWNILLPATPPFRFAPRRTPWPKLWLLFLLFLTLLEPTARQKERVIFCYMFFSEGPINNLPVFKSKSQVAVADLISYICEKRSFREKNQPKQQKTRQPYSSVLFL